jgi:hypothetical protein
MRFWHIFAKIFVFAKKIPQRYFFSRKFSEKPVCVKDRRKCARQLGKISCFCKKCMLVFLFISNRKEGDMLYCSWQAKKLSKNHLFIVCFTKSVIPLNEVDSVHCIVLIPIDKKYLHHQLIFIVHLYNYKM